MLSEIYGTDVLYNVSVSNVVEDNPGPGKKMMELLIFFRIKILKS